MFEFLDKVLDLILGEKEPDVREYPIPQDADVQDFLLKRSMEETAQLKAKTARLQREIERMMEAGQVVQMRDIVQEAQNEVRKRRVFSERQREITLREIQDFVDTGKIIAYSKEGSKLGELKDIGMGVDNDTRQNYVYAMWKENTGKEGKAYAGDLRNLVHYYDNLTNQLADGSIHLNFKLAEQKVIPDVERIDKVNGDDKKIDEIIYDLNRKISELDEKKRELEFMYETSNKRAENAELQIGSFKELLRVNKMTTQDLHVALQDYSKTAQLQKKQDVQFRESKVELETQLEMLREAVTGLQGELLKSTNKSEMTKQLSLLNTMADLVKNLGAKAEPQSEEPEPRKPSSNFSIGAPQEQPPLE